MYKIELSPNKTGSCVKKELTEEFHRFEVPKNATGITKVTIGSNGLPDVGVTVNVFAGEIKGGKSSCLCGGKLS